MTQEKKNSQLTDTIWKGEITDSKGRILKLRNPSLWDEYGLCKIMGKDSENSQCLMMGEFLIKVAAIDNVILGTPTSYNEFSANLSKLGHEGLNALLEHAQKNIGTQAEAKEEIKK